MPTGYTPIYKIMKGGQDITSHFNDRTTEISVTLKGGGGDADICKITVDDRDWRIAAVEVGAKLEIYLGYKEVGLAQMGVFQVDTVDYVAIPRQIEIVGNSTGFTGAIKAPTVQNFQNKKLGEIIKSLVESKGGEAYVAPEFRDVELPYLNMNSSPLHMLHELERRFGATAKWINGKFVFQPRDEGEGEGGMEMPVLVIEPWHITKAFVRHSQRSKYDGVKVGYFDQDHVKHYVEQKDPDAEEGADDFFLSKQIGRNKAEAEFMAKSQQAALRRAEGEAHITLAKGDPWVRDQQRILMRRFRDKINGSYIVDTVTHTYIKDPGISTEILAKPPGTDDDYEDLDEGVFMRLGQQLPSLESVEPGKIPAVPESIDNVKPIQKGSPADWITVLSKMAAFGIPPDAQTYALMYRGLPVPQELLDRIDQATRAVQGDATTSPVQIDVGPVNL